MQACQSAIRLGSFVCDAAAWCHEVGGSAKMSIFGAGSPVIFRP